MTPPPAPSLAGHLRALAGAGQATRALQVGLRHLEQTPQDLQVRLLVIDLLSQRGRLRDALSQALQATERHPTAPEGPSVLASLLEQGGNAKGALQAWDLAATRAPAGNGEALRRGGDLCWRIGDLPGALKRLRAAVKAEPSAAGGWAVLAAAEAGAERLAAAREAAARALSLAPDLPAVQRLSADVAEKQGDVETARRAYRRLGASPQALWAHAVALPPVTQSADQEDQVRETWRAELTALAEAHQQSPPADAPAWLAAVRGVFPLHYTGGDLVAEQRDLGALVHAVVARALPESVAPPPRPQRDRPLVVFATSTFRKHTVTKLFSRWMQALDRSRVAVEALDVGLVHDSTTAELARWCDAVHTAPGSPAEALAVLRNRAPDVVVFPEVGMDARILQLAGARSAPLQLVAWGHPVTTGLPTLDGFLSSTAMAVAPDRVWTTEHRIDLPGIGALVAPPDRPEDAERARFGLPEDRTLLLCVQSLFKYRPWTDALFVEIASRAPEALLVFIEDRRGLVTDTWKARLGAAFQQAGLVLSEHVRVLPRLPEADWLRLLCVGDLFLDSPGWSGGNTTLEALALGLPTLAFPGDTLRGRHCRGMVLEADLPALAPDTQQAWLNAAVDLARTPSTRRDLAEAVRRQAPALFHDVRSVRALEALFEQGLPPRRA